MKGKLVAIFRKWWLIALVMTLAMSLTSCANRQRMNYADYGWLPCQGPLGYFEVYVINSPTQPGTYQLSVIPVSVSQPGDIVTVTVANRSNAYQEKVSQVVLVPNQEIAAGYLTQSDLSTFKTVAITPFQAGANFLDASTPYDTYCSLPGLGDGVGQTVAR